LLAAALAGTPALAVDRDLGVKPPPVEGAPDFVDLQPIVLSVIDHSQVTRQVGILLTLELAPGQAAHIIDPKRRQLMDAFIRELHGIYSARSTTARVVDEGMIKQRLLHTANGVLGKGVVHAILVRRLLEQR
jgi:hypothetical protein